MGTQLSNIKKLVKSRSTLASFLLVPAVVCGLALLGFQTYSLITGKSFKDLDFDIGRLWSSSDEQFEIQPLTQSVISRTVPLFTESIPKIKSVSSSDIIVPKPIRKLKTFSPIVKNEKSVITKSVEELIDLDNIKSVKINTALQSPQLERYFSRLESEYLINPDLVPDEGKWYVGLNFAPCLGYRTFSYDPSAVSGVALDGRYRYTYGLTEASRNLRDKSITSYSIGIDVGRRISDRVSIFSGINYAHYGEQVLVSYLDETNPNLPGSRFMDKDPLYERYNEDQKDANIPFTNKYSYIEIPIGASVEIANLPKAKISVDAALHYQRLENVNALVYDFETDYYYWADQKEEVFRLNGLASSIGITLAQYVTERFEVFVNPQFKYNLTSTFQRPYAVTQNQYTSGLRIGIKQHLF